MSALSHKQIGFSLLWLLQAKTDRNHRLNQEEMLAILQEETGLQHTRKAIRANLQELQTAGFPIRFDKGWYYDRELTGAELHLIVDALRSANGITVQQQQAMSDKICRLGGEPYAPQSEKKALKPENPGFMDHLELLHTAVSKGVAVRLIYGNYAVDRQLHPLLNRNGRPREYTVDPYHVVVTNGKHYLIGHVPEHPGLVHFRVDHIMELRLMRKKACPMEQVYPEPFDPAVYVAQHPFMYSGPVFPYRLRIFAREGIGNVLDWFGTDIQLEELDGTAYATVISDESSMKQWLKRYSDQAELLEEK